MSFKILSSGARSIILTLPLCKKLTHWISSLDDKWKLTHCVFLAAIGWQTTGNWPSRCLVVVKYWLLPIKIRDRYVLFGQDPACVVLAAQEHHNLVVGHGSEQLQNVPFSHFSSHPFDRFGRFSDEVRSFLFRFFKTVPEGKVFWSQRILIKS